MTDKGKAGKTKGESATGHGALKLTDNEKRDIMKLLEADKPLPDRYRFLLFEDNREVEKGKIAKLVKDKQGVFRRETLTDHWTDWIDYWSVDFDFESKREIIRVQQQETGEVTEQWAGDYIFENEWQSFRTKKDRSLELTSVAHECPPGRRKLAVKVVDIFGNDTMTIVEVSV